MQRSSQRWIAVGLTVAGTVGIGAAVDARSSAEITASFADACRDFEAHSTKDISHVEIHYADGRVVKDETIGVPDYSLDGGVGDEIEAAVVKSGTTIETFDCRPASSPPVALLESARCGFGLCGEWTSVDSDGTHERCSHYQDTIPFRGSNSNDPDNDIVSWSIDFGDGTAPVSGAWATEPPVGVGHVFNTLGGALFTVTLTVTNSAGRTGVDTIVVCLSDFTPD